MRRTRCIIICFFLAWSAVQPLFSQPVISEFLALNSHGIQDPDFQEYADWIEVYNPGDTGMDISGYSLTDDLGRPGKWLFPAGSRIEANAFLLIWADDRNTGLHCSFKLSGSGEQIGLFDPQGVALDTVSFGLQQTDISFGRQGTSGNWIYFPEPTPGLPNSTEGYAGISGESVFSVPGGFYSSAISLDLSAPAQGALIMYTMDGSEPDSSSMEFQSSLVISGTKTIRTRIYEEGKLPGNVVNQSYFINEPDHDLPVISISTRPDFLWDNEEGIYVNYTEEWEKPCGLEFFNASGGREFSVNAGLRIFGGTSRGRPQKSLSIHMRNQYGDGSINYPLLPGREISEFRSFILRNSANDWSGDWRGTMFRDALIHTIVEGQMDLDYQSYQPVLVYLNGAYWGIHNLRDKHNEDYCEVLYGIDNDSIDIIKHNEVVAGDDVLYKEMMDFLENHSLVDSLNYQLAATMIDIDEFISYMIAEIYSCNIDWPANNHRLWRATTTEGRWRWMLFDTEFGFNGFQWAAPSTNMFSKALDPDIDDYVNKDQKAPWATLVFIKLTQNESFRRQFTSAYLSHIYTTYSPGRVLGIVDSLALNLESEMPRHIERWGNEGGIYSMDTWRLNVEGMKDFALERPPYARQHLMETFDIRDEDQVNLEIEQGEGGMVELNGISLDQAHFENEYFLGLPLNLEIKPKPGYDFRGWKIEDSAHQKSQYIKSGGDWRFLDDGSEPSVAWTQPDFDDTSWKTGQTKFGFGDGNEKTMVSFGEDVQNKYISYFFRTEFDVEDVESVINLEMSLLRDDGAVVYLNGNEIKRSNMTSRAVNAQTLALMEVIGSDESAYLEFSIDLGTLLKGRNVMAVEVHQASANSSDMGFDLELTGTSSLPREPYLITTPSLKWILEGDVKITSILESSGVIPDLRINEILAGNSGGISDEFGDQDDWIEIYNAGDESISLGGLFITDSLPNPHKWEIPAGSPLSTTIEPGGFIILWADNEPEEGANHLGFKLSKEGEELGLFKLVDDDLILLDSISFISLPSDVSFARVPDGEGDWTLFSNPTPAAPNFYLGEAEEKELPAKLMVYPNPSTGRVSISGLAQVSNSGEAEVSILDELGRVVHFGMYSSNEITGLDLTAFDAGLYLILINTGDRLFTQRVILLK